jgi:hypothetical protein
MYEDILDCEDEDIIDEEYADQEDERTSPVKSAREKFMDAVRTFFDDAEGQIEERLQSLYQKDLDRLQKEIVTIQSEKHSLADTVMAMQRHIDYLEKRLLQKEGEGWVSLKTK